MIGEQLRTLRTANKMTQKELAGELSVAFQTISNWENNSIDPSVSMILRIAEYFNCSTDYLLKGDDSSAKYIDTTSARTTSWACKGILQTEQEIKHNFIMFILQIQGITTLLRYPVFYLYYSRS